MNITSAKYCLNREGQNGTIEILLSSGEKLWVPIKPENTDYAEIMRQVEAGTLVVAEAD